MYALYNALLFLVIIIGSPLFIAVLLTRKHHRSGFFQKFGFLPWQAFLSTLASRPIWIHAVSVGEVMTAIPLIKEIKKAFPAAAIILSTATATGKLTAERKVKSLDRSIYFPFDFPFVARRFISRIRPQLFIALETELWPNFLREIKRHNTPALIISGRISRRSFPAYMRFKFFFKRVLKNIACFCMQTPADAERIIAMGADQEKVFITGNLKFDLSIPVVDQVATDSLYTALNLNHKQRIFIAGSTHKGEEEIILDGYQALKKAMPDLALILAPRHPERFAEVASLMQARGITFTRKTAVETSSKDTCNEVVLLDTIGDLTKLYHIGTCIFIGGSLVPIGGHNVLEPAVFKKPILFGPYMNNFLEIARTLVAKNAGMQIHGKEDLIQKATLLLNDSRLREKLGENAFQVVAENTGALHRSLEKIKPFLEQQLQ